MAHSDKKVLAFDIGGANLKLADGRGFALAESFPLWQHPDKLSAALKKMLAAAPACDQLAVTMTGELADCFSSKAEGVRAILDAVEQASEKIEVAVYTVDGQFLSMDCARETPILAAASNWHALAQFAAHFLVGESGLLIDIGSTTTDIIPLTRNGPHALARTDPERLAAGELLYTGVVRSPVCALVETLAWNNKPCSVAKELFATTLDAYLLLGDCDEDRNNQETADGRPRTTAYAHARLARMICADTTMFSLDDARRAAESIAEAQTVQLASCLDRVLKRFSTPPSTVVFSGQGEFLARRVWDQLASDATKISLTEQLGADVSRVACAHALAVLAEEKKNL